MHISYLVNNTMAVADGSLAVGVAVEKEGNTAFDASA